MYMYICVYSTFIFIVKKTYYIVINKLIDTSFVVDKSFVDNICKKKNHVLTKMHLCVNIL